MASSKISSLVPSKLDKQKDQLANNLSVIAQIRAYVIATEHTRLSNILDPPPSWFKTLSSNLDTAKKHAQIWTNTIEPGITTNMPQGIMNMGSRFDTGTSAILKILNDSGFTPSTAQVKTITEALDWISANLKTQNENLKALQKTFLTFQTNAQADFDALTKGNDSIQNAILADNKIITTLTGDIAVDNANIAKDNAAITAAALAAGIGLFVGVAAVGLGAASTGPAAPIVIAIGAFIIVASIVEAATVIAIYEKKLAAAQSKLDTDTASLHSEQKQVAALTIMNNSITSLVSKNQAMAQSLQDLIDWFADVAKQVDTVSGDIKSAQSDLSKSDWFGMSLDVTQAQKDWKDLVTLATQWRSSVTNMQQHIIDARKAKAA